MINYTYRIVIKPWYPSVTIQKASLDSIGFKEVKWENVTSVAGSPQAVINTITQEVNKMFNGDPKKD